MADGKRQVRRAILRARRAPRFWGTALAAVAGLAAMWAQIPFAALLGKPPRPAGGDGAAADGVPARRPGAAYVLLDPSYAARVFQSIRSSWGSPRRGGALSVETAPIDFPSPPPPPWTLAAGRVYPGEWAPAGVRPLPQPPPPIDPPPAGPAKPGRDAPAPAPPGPALLATLSPALQAAGFTFEPPGPPFPEPSGSGGFDVETDESGQVVHLLSRTPLNATLRRLERALGKGRASGPARGRVSVEWK